MTKPISGKEMRRAREEGVSVPLSSGIWVALRPVPVDQLLLAGEIPDFLTGMAAASIMEPGSETPSPEAHEDVVKKYVTLANLIVKLALVHPKIVDDPQTDDECKLEDFSEAERGEIFAYSRHSGERLRRFRDEQAANVATVSKSETDIDATEQAS